MPSTISIHALREEGDIFLHHSGRTLKNFYPRPPRGGRRFRLRVRQRTLEFLSTPSARRATREHPWPGNGAGISIHALREEGDAGGDSAAPAAEDFYPRPPRGGRPGLRRCPVRHPDFYPRPPRGGRRTTTPTRRRLWQFLSTPSARRATRRRQRLPARRHISIHALREEGDADVVRKYKQLEISIHALREEGDQIRLIVL